MIAGTLSPRLLLKVVRSLQFKPMVDQFHTPLTSSYVSCSSLKYHNYSIMRTTPNDSLLYDFIILVRPANQKYYSYSDSLLVCLKPQIPFKKSYLIQRILYNNFTYILLYGSSQTAKYEE